MKAANAQKKTNADFKVDDLYYSVAAGAAFGTPEFQKNNGAMAACPTCKCTCMSQQRR